MRVQGTDKLPDRRHAYYALAENLIWSQMSGIKRNISESKVSLSGVDFERWKRNRLGVARVELVCSVWQVVWRLNSCGVLQFV